MSAPLAVLCLAAFAAVAALTSLIVHGMLFALDRVAQQIPARARARVWLGLSAAPLLVGAVAVGSSFLPAMGIGDDHCLAHGPHHPHLCPNHLSAAPGAVLIVLSTLAALRFGAAIVALGRALWLSRVTSITLSEASRALPGRGDALVFPADDPQAFVLGALRPRVYVSTGLLELGPEVATAVVAHERIHARRRDLLWRALFPSLSLGHLPIVAEALRRRLWAAQEHAADAEASETLPNGRLRIAEAILAMARCERAPVASMPFTGGNLNDRVRALLEGPFEYGPGPARFLILASLASIVTLAAAHDVVHHGLETFLGALS